MELDKLVEAYAQGMALEKKARKKLDDMRKKIENYKYQVEILELRKINGKN